MVVTKKKSEYNIIAGTLCAKKKTKKIKIKIKKERKKEKKTGRAVFHSSSIP